MSHCIRSLIASAILAHALFGCCASSECCVVADGVAAGGLNDDRPAYRSAYGGDYREVTHAMTGCCGASHSQEEPAIPATPHECQHDQCHWLTADGRDALHQEANLRAQAMADRARGACTLLAPVGASAGASSARYAAFSELASLSPPPVRTHVAQGIWIL